MAGAGELLLLPTLLQVQLTDMVSGNQDEIVDVEGSWSPRPP
jgi:hypothetical protein